MPQIVSGIWGKVGTDDILGGAITKAKLAYPAGLESLLKEYTSKDSLFVLYSSSYHSAGPLLYNFKGTISRVELILGKDGSPTGTGYFRIIRWSDKAILREITLDVSTLSTTETWVSFELSNPLPIDSPTDVAIVFYYSGGDGSNYVEAFSYASDVDANVAHVAQLSDDSWHVYSDHDSPFKIYRTFYGPTV